MKLNFGKKLLLLIHWLFSLAVCALFVLSCAAPQMLEQLASLVNSAIGAGFAEILSFFALAVYVLISVLTLVTVFSKDKKRGEKGLITVDSSDAGRTRVSVAAIDQMVRQSVRGVDGISEMKCAISNADDAISINANVVLMAGAHVPTVTMNMQRAIRGYIELNCGVAVREICVNVNSVEGGADGKRSSRKNLTAAAPAAGILREPAETMEETAPEQPAVAEELPAEEIAEEAEDVKVEEAVEE